MTVRDIARTDVVAVGPEESAERIADRMRSEHVGSVVVTEDDRPIGLVTDRDLGLGVWDLDAPSEATAQDLMTEDPVTVAADEGLYEALGVAASASVRRLPVVDGDELVGIVSLDDFLVLLAGEFDRASQIIQAESPPY